MNKKSYRDLVEFVKTGKVDDSSPIFKNGFGSLKALLLDLDEVDKWPTSLQKFAPEVEDFRNALIDHHDPQMVRKIIQSLKSSTLTSFFTPPEIVIPLTKALGRYDPKMILEPSAGTGNIIEYLHYKRESITAIEKDYLTHQFLSSKHPSTNAICGGFEDFKTQLRFDLVISNIPFGSIQVFDQGYYASKNRIKIQSTTRIHNYFFVKALDFINPGGRIAFIVSSNFLDTPGNGDIRKYLNQQAKLISAVRLPNNVFFKAGTKPTCDIIILEKRQGPSDQDQFVTTGSISIGSNEYPLNKHYVENSQLLLGDLAEDGQYNNELALTSNRDLSELSNDLFSILSEHIDRNKKQLSPTNSEIQRLTEDTRIRPIGPLGSHFAPGNLYIQKAGIYRINQDAGGYSLEPISKVKFDIEQVNALIQLRLTYLKLLECDGDPDSSNLSEEVRSSLNKQYDVLRFRFGPLNGQINARPLALEIDAHILKGLEGNRSSDYQKAEIFSNALDQVDTQQVRVESLSDAIVLSLNQFNTIDESFIYGTLDITYQELVYLSIKEDLLYLEKKALRWQLVTKSEFTSGHIQSKLDALTSFPQQFNEYYEVHKNLLFDHKPEWISFDLLDINLGERWIPIEIWTEFLNDFFSTDDHKVTVQLIYTKATDKYSIKIHGFSPVDHTDFAIRRKTSGHRLYGHKLMEHAFADTSPVLKYTVLRGGQEIQVVDHEATRQAQDKLEGILEMFQQWLSRQAHHQKTIENRYNQLFNSIAPRLYDGSHLELKELQYFEAYSSQKNAVYRNLCKQGGVNDHIVGAGKSLVMAITCHEMKRLGLANKPMIVCLKANVSSVYKEYIKAYPNDKVLHPEDKHFEPKNRAVLFQQMLNNNWDAIIITHDQFKMIPQSPEIEINILEDELENIELDLKVLRAETDTTLTTQLAKGLEKRKGNLVKKIGQLRSFGRDQLLPDFKRLGIDHLFVDESHIFKNLMYTTRHRNVSGLGNPAGSQRAYNMLIACRTIQAHYGEDKGITFLSGTTISNSLVELYLIFKYLCPKKLLDLEINSFDAWAKVYAVKSGEFEFSVTNEVKRKDRYREFIKVPELAKFYTELADVVNEQNFKVDRPKIETKLINIKPTPDQEEYMDCLVQFAKTKNPNHIGLHLSNDELKAYMLIATNYAKKMSLDMRIIDPNLYEFDPGSKVAIAAENIASIYKRTTEHLGTQLVFSDLSTPSNGFNIYDELKRLLVEKGIPSEEIEFIHDAKTRKATEALEDRFNAGRTRVLLGSTTKLGIGKNVQKRVVAMHHLDAPWTPANFDQRNGRGGRQGNEIAPYYDNTVLNFIYAVERSLDSYQFNLLQNKSRFISQIKSGSIKVRRIDEGSMGGEAGEQQMNFAEYVAMLSGNQSLLKISKIDRKIKDLEILRAAHISDQNQARTSSNFWSESIDGKLKMIRLFNQDLNAFQDLNKTPDEIKKEHKRFYYPKPVCINGQHHYDTEQIGKILRDLLTNQKFKKGKMTQIATFGKFELIDDGENRIMLIGAAKYQIHSSDLLGEKPVLSGRRIYDRLTTIPKLITDCNGEIDVFKLRIEQNERILSTTFDRIDELNDLRAEKKRLLRELEEVEEEALAEDTKGDVAVQKSAKTIKIDSSVIEVLTQCFSDDLMIRLPDYQIERTLYRKTKKVLQNAGGTWTKGNDGGFLFDHNTADLLQRLQNGEVINIKQQYQTFYTSESLANRMVQLLDLKPEHLICEPEAGQGALIKAIHRISPNHNVHYYELLDTNRAILSTIPNTSYLGDEFLEAPEYQKFDRIIANPPFSKNQDIEHIYQMYSSLKPGGKIVTVASYHWTFANGSVEEGFREFVETHAVLKEVLPEGTFREAGTHVKSMLLIIQKPLD